MGGRGYVAKYKNIVTPRQAERFFKTNRIKPTRQYGEWYAQVDPDTGAIKWIRKKIKKRK